jgi:hypothetical protein
MTNKEILSLAKFAYNEAKARDFRDRMKPFDIWMVEFILNFYSLVKELEIENCAKTCEDFGRAEEMQAIGNDFATAIRERKENYV